MVVPAAYLYLLRDGPTGTEVLLQLRGATGYMDRHWAAAAGHVERGESAWAAARREAAEEIGIADPGLRFVTTMHRTGGDLPIDERVDFFFTAREWSGTPQILEPTKCLALEWFSLSALPDPVVPHELVVLQALATGAVPPLISVGFDRHP